MIAEIILLNVVELKEKVRDEFPRYSANVRNVRHKYRGSFQFQCKEKVNNCKLFNEFTKEEMSSILLAKKIR